MKITLKQETILHWPKKRYKKTNCIYYYLQTRCMHLSAIHIHSLVTTKNQKKEKSYEQEKTNKTEKHVKKYHRK